jgi:hypothetical protein
LTPNARVAELLQLVAAIVLQQQQKASVTATEADDIDGKEARRGGEAKRRRKCMMDTVVDVSQTINRRPFSRDRGDGKQVLPCLTTTSILYSYRLGRVLVPSEHWLLQGAPTLRSDNISAAQLRRSAGEGFCAPCIGAVMLCVIAAIGELQQS